MAFKKLAAGLILIPLSVIDICQLTFALDRVTVGLSSTSSVNGAIWYNVLADLVDMDIYYLQNALGVTRSISEVTMIPRPAL